MESVLREIETWVDSKVLRSEQKIDFTRENLENQIKANEKNMEKQFSFQQKLLWVVFGLFAKAIHLI